MRIVQTTPIIYFFLLLLQSKNGGVTSWEPAGAQKWLEVSIVLICSISFMKVIH
jgi:hypothetical protein